MGEQRHAATPVSPRADLPTAAAVVFAAALPSLVTWLYFIVLAGPGNSDLLRQGVAAGVKVVEVAFPLAFVVLWEKRWPRPTWPRKEGVALGLGFGLIVAAGIVGLYFAWLRGSSVLSHTPNQLIGVLQRLGITSALGFLGLSGIICVANSLFEEYYFRWFIFGRMRPFLPLPAAVVLGALVFMAHHVILLSVYLPGHFWTAVVPLSLFIAVGGGVWSWLYARTGSLYAPWLSHALIDGAVVVVGWDLWQRAGA
jgi:membrane protease YdiL (CAAX protease family)